MGDALVAWLLWPLVAVMLGGGLGIVVRFAWLWFDGARKERRTELDELRRRVVRAEAETQLVWGRLRAQQDRIVMLERDAFLVHQKLPPRLNVLEAKVSGLEQLAFRGGAHGR